MHLKWHLSYASGYIALGLLNEAESELGRLSAEDLDQTPALEIRLELHQCRNEWPEARDLAAELCRRHPENSAWWVAFAYSTRRAGSLGAAEAILLAAQKLHASDPTIIFNLGCYACQRGDLDLARTRVARAIELDEHFRQLADTDPDLSPLRQA